MPGADPYETIAAYYDLEHASLQDDVEFYLNVLHSGPVLEVGTGTGRVMLALVRSGLEVWGVDRSEAMLRVARRRLEGYPGAHLVQADARELRLNTSFAAALLPLNTLWHLTDVDAQIRALRGLRPSLIDGGMLVIDLSNPFTMVDRGGLGEVRQRFEVQDGERHITGYSAAWDDRATQLLRLSLSYEATAPNGAIFRSRAELDLRYLYRFELELLLRHCGYRLRELFGSYSYEEYSETSPNLIALASPD